jgi:Lon protease-like protein
MMTMPLFPLNTVLFPGMPLSLHIFEDRYKQMIGKCLETRQPFGVVLIEQGTEALGPLAQPYAIGCTAQITQVQPLSQGRMNIVAVGQERFRITALNFDMPYLMGDVELMPIANPDPASLVRQSRKLRPWLERYLQLLAQADNLQFDFQQLPAEPMSMVYLAAFLLQIAPEQKQELLSSETADQMVTQVLTTYRRETTLLRAMLQRQPTEEDSLFSLN